MKSVETLKKEKELLMSEKVKLKSENKSLEKELKKVTSKDRLTTRRMSQSTLDESAFDSDVLKEKIQVLEDQLTERDRIAALLKLRLDKSHTEFNESSEFEDMERSSNSVRGTKNGTVLDPTVALEMLLEEHDVSLRLRRENEELKSRLWMTEAELDSHKGQQRDLPNQQSPKSPRKRSSGFFKRGKKSTSSMPVRHALNDDSNQAKSDLVRSQSPEKYSVDPHNEQLDVSSSPPLYHHPNKVSTTSLPTQRSPNLSPRMMNRNRTREEILTLQSCLKLAIEEKNASNESKALLENELDEARRKIFELSESSSTSVAKASTEIERLKNFLKAAEMERDTFCEELKIAQHEIDDLVEKREKMDRKHTEAISEKNSRIKELEQELESIKKMKISSPPFNKPPAYGAMMSPKKLQHSSPSRERIISPPQQYKDASFSRLSSESSGSEKSSHGSKQLSSERSRERLSSNDLSKPKERLLSSDLSKPKERNDLSKPKERLSSSDLSKPKERLSSSDLSKPRERLSSSDLSKPKERLSSSDLSKPRERLPSGDLSKPRLSRDKSQEKLVQSNLPPSPSRKVGRLSRESSIDRFESPPKEVKRKISNSGVSSPSLAHSPKVSATRAMFEQKIDDSKSDQSSGLRRTSKPSSLLEQKRRMSIPTVIPVRDNKESSQTMHSKSYSYDYSSKESPKVRNASESSTGSTDKTESAPTTNAMRQTNGPRVSPNEARNKANSTQNQQQEKAHTVTSSAAIRKINNSSPSKLSDKVSRITITSVASPSNSPVLSNRKEIAASSSREEHSQSPLLSRNSTSPSLTTSTMYSKSNSPTSPAKGHISPANTTRVSTVSTTVRHSSPQKSATVSEISTPTQKTHSPVTKSQTESKLQPPSTRTSGIWSNSSHTPQITTSTVSSTPAPNRVVVKTTSRLGGSLLSSANKSGGSLQNISAQVNGTSENNSSESPAKASTSNASSGIRRGPVHKAIQRRDRKERPKTMYAGRAETTNLVNLISKFQEAEKEKKQKEGQTGTMSITSVPRPVSPHKQNGTSSGPVTTFSQANTTRAVNSSSSSNSFTSTSVTMRQHGGKDRLPRPTSYCSTNTTR